MKILYLKYSANTQVKKLYRPLGAKLRDRGIADADKDTLKV